MPQVALNNLSSFAAPAIGSQSAALSGNPRGFGDHLQRASQDGAALDGNGEGAPENKPSQGTTTPQSAGGQGDDPKPAVNTNSPRPAAQPSAPPRDARKRSDSGNDSAPEKSTDSSENRQKQSADHARPSIAGSETAATVCTAAQVVSQTLAVAARVESDEPSPGGASAAKTDATAINAQSNVAIVPKTNFSDGQSPLPPTAVNGNAAISQTNSSAPLTEQPQPPTSDAAQPADRVESAAAEQLSVTVAAASPAATLTQAVATAGIAASLRPTAAAGAVKSSVQSVATSAPAPGGSDQSKPARTERTTDTARHPAATTASTDVHAAADIAPLTGESDFQTRDSSLTSNHKDNAAPTAENVAAARSQLSSVGLNAGNAAESPKPAASVTPTPQSGSSSSAGEVDRVRFIQRVAGAFQAADEQGGQIRLRLSPPELGSMRLEISVRNGVMTAHVQTETDTARNMLLDHLPQLRDRLADHNIKIDHFDVELTNQSRSGTPQNFTGNANPRQPPVSGGGRTRPASAANNPTTASPVGVRAVNGRLDVTV
jgi:flagellar hook-length control protein FliK